MHVITFCTKYFAHNHEISSLAVPINYGRLCRCALGYKFVAASKFYSKESEEERSKL